METKCNNFIVLNCMCVHMYLYIGMLCFYFEYVHSWLYAYVSVNMWRPEVSSSIPCHLIFVRQNLSLKVAFTSHLGCTAEEFKVSSYLYIFVLFHINARDLNSGAENVLSIEPSPQYLNNSFIIITKNICMWLCDWI